MRQVSRRSERAVLVALGVTGVLALAKVVAALATGSLAALSQAFDSVLDLVALTLLYVGLRVAAKPADETHHYGHAKAENIAALLQTTLIGLIIVGIAIEALMRLGRSDVEVDAPLYAIALFAVSIAVDGIRFALLTRVGRAEDSDALRAGALNFAMDAGTSLVALISLIVVRAGATGADSIGALVVAVVIGIAAVKLGRRSVDVLMDRVPSLPLDEISAAAARAPGVSEARRVRVRGSGKQVFADVTVAAGRTASLERAHDIAERVEEEIARVAPGADVVVHVEPISETSGLIERVQAAASRAEGVHEVHNVLVHAFSEGGRSRLHVTLHAKVGHGTTLAEAHDLSDRVEEIVRAELGEEVRVDTHIEPLEPTAHGTDVTDSRPDLVGLVRKLAAEEDDVLDCHEVLITQTDQLVSVVAHVHGRADAPLARLHRASERIENALRAERPEIGPVLIHFEPV